MRLSCDGFSFSEYVSGSEICTKVCISSSSTEGIIKIAYNASNPIVYITNSKRITYTWLILMMPTGSGLVRKRVSSTEPCFQDLHPDLRFSLEQCIMNI